MKPQTGHNTHIQGVIKDSIIILLIFAAFSFIDLRVAAFVAVICTVIILTRRSILYYNPGFVKGHHLSIDGNNITVPNGVDVFDLSRFDSIEYLYKYVEVIRGILIPPKVLIIRFCGITILAESELKILREALQLLKISRIAVVFSDVNETVRSQLNESEIQNEVATDKIFYSIREALTNIKKL